MTAAADHSDKNTTSRSTAKRKATFNLDAKLHQRLKVRAAQENRRMVEIVEEALHKYLGDK